MAQRVKRDDILNVKKPAGAFQHNALPWREFSDAVIQRELRGAGFAKHGKVTAFADGPWAQLACRHRGGVPFYGGPEIRYVAKASFDGPFNLDDFRKGNHGGFSNSRY